MRRESGALAVCEPMKLAAPPMTDHPEQPTGEPSGEGRRGIPEARRAKLARIAELGHDPWGQRFDDRQWIADIRGLASQITFRKADGADIVLPPLETDDERAGFRQWVADQGAGEMHGPQVRAA